MQCLFAYTSKTAAPGIKEESVHGTQGGRNALANYREKMNSTRRQDFHKSFRFSLFPSAQKLRGKIG